MGLVFVFKVDTSKVSWSLTGSHGSMTARVKSWGVGKLSEYLRDRSASRVLAPRGVWSSWSLGHPRHGSQYVTVWSCAVPMWRFCCLRCELEWSGRQTSTANALRRHWRRGQVQVATVCGPVWKLGSQKKSWFQMVSVSDGLARFGSVRICRTGQAACPDFGTVEFGVVCDGFGRLSFFVLQCWEEIWRGLGGFALFSVCFVCSRSAEASYKRWLCPFVSPDPKWEAFRGQRVARASCLTRRTVLLGWFFIQVFATRLCLCYSDSILLFMLFWGSWCCRLPSFLMCFDTREMWSVAYAPRIYGSSCPEVPAAYTTFQAWSWGSFLPWTNQFEANQIPKRIVKNHGRTWCVRILKSGFWLGNFSLIWMLPPSNFPGCKNCRTASLSCASCRGNPTEPLDRWRTHRTPTVAIEMIHGAKPVCPWPMNSAKNRQGENHLAWYIMV